MKRLTSAQRQLISEWVRLQLEFKRGDDDDEGGRDERDQSARTHNWYEKEPEARLPDVKPRGEEGPGRPRKKPNDDFAQFIDNAPEDPAKIARELGITRQYMDKLARDDAKPSLELANKIDDKTSGEVAVEDWE
jgi:DNA-binding XRE family transcriptional regulator